MEILPHAHGRGRRRLAFTSRGTPAPRREKRDHAGPIDAGGPLIPGSLEPGGDSARLRKARSILGRSCLKAILTSQRGTQNPGVTSSE